MKSRPWERQGDCGGWWERIWLKSIVHVWKWHVLAWLIYTHKKGLSEMKKKKQHFCREAKRHREDKDPFLSCPPPGASETLRTHRNAALKAPLTNFSPCCSLPTYPPSSLSICPFIVCYLSTCTTLHMWIPPIHPWTHPSIHTSIYPCVRAHKNMFIYPPNHHSSM